MPNLSTKYRPHDFDDVVGQVNTVKILKAQVAENKVAPVIGFFGASGCGKTTLARIIANKINKGKGLTDVCTYLGVNLCDTAAFGDSENDIPMLEEAGCGVAMENAEKAVKMCADKITLSNNQDGIAYAMKNWIKI